MLGPPPRGRRRGWEQRDTLVRLVKALINGREGAVVGVGDRGLLYGDGLFETIAVRGRSLCLWGAHLDRLGRGADRLGIPRPDPQLLLTEAAWLAQSLGPVLGEGTLRLTVTRGPGGRGYRPPTRPSPTRIWSLYAATPATRGVGRGDVALTVCRTRFGDNPALAGIKHLNRLEQVLAQSEWDEPAIFDGLMMDQRGRVVSGTRSNLFLVTARGLVTPSLERCGVAGTARATVIERCTALGIPVVEREIRWRELADAQGLFVTNALVGLLPVSRVDAVRFDPSAIPAALVDQVREAVFTSEASC